MKFNNYIYILVVLVLSSGFLLGQQVEKPTTGRFLLKSGQVYTHDKGMISADLLIDNGRIVDVGSKLQSEAAQVIDCDGLEIYPGMIDSGTKLGLAEIGAVSLTQDHSEIGTYTPHMQALTAVNPSSVNIPVNRVNGITTVLAVPGGGLFPGTAALIDLMGYTPDQMYAGFKGVVLRFPSSGKRGRWDRRSAEDIEKDNKKAKKKLTEFWKNAKVYASIKGANPNAELEYNPQMDALVDVINGAAKILIEANKKSDILAALKWVNENKLDAVFTGVAEGYRVADSLAKYKIPVITGPILSNPSRDSDKYDVAYANASLMHKAGVKVAIRTNETENVRNLPYNAGFATTYGLSWEDAFKAITITPAEIFGIADDYGSLEKGKMANLFVSNGDPFETKTQIKHLFIKGWKVPLESRHTLLYEEFLERDPSLIDNNSKK